MVTAKSENGQTTEKLQCINANLDIALCNRLIWPSKWDFTKSKFSLPLMSLSYLPGVRHPSQYVTQPATSSGPFLPNPGPQGASQSSVGQMQWHLVIQPPGPVFVSYWWPWHSAEQSLFIQPHVNKTTLWQRISYEFGTPLLNIKRDIQQRCPKPHILTAGRAI